jgi:hypothetical protein
MQSAKLDTHQMVNEISSHPPQGNEHDRHAKLDRSSFFLQRSHDFLMHLNSMMAIFRKNTWTTPEFCESLGV